MPDDKVVIIRTDDVVTCILAVSQNLQLRYIPALCIVIGILILKRKVHISRALLKTGKTVIYESRLQKLILNG